LYEYVDFINSYGTPTVITRRDGAIVAASKEFSILTGWSKGVLLGKEPNLNVNSGGASGASTGGLSSASRTRLSSVEEERPGRNGESVGKEAATTLQPALMAEIMDQDSVVQFYEDYAKLAFGDPRGFGIRRGKLLKYKTKEDIAASDAEANRPPILEQHAHSRNPSISANEQKRKRASSIKHEPGVVKMEGSEGRISGEAAINRLGEKEGMVDVMYCWNVRRDVFEVPMLIVMNFLPII